MSWFRRLFRRAKADAELGEEIRFYLDQEAQLRSSVGIPAALAASGIVRGLLFGLTPADPLSIAGATVALILIALPAGYLPARRACRVDPMQALRYE